MAILSYKCQVPEDVSMSHAAVKNKDNLVRSVELRYTAAQLTQQTIDKICRYYNNNIQISQIVRQINGPLCGRGTIAIHDVYTVLWHAMFRQDYTSVKVKQRKKFREIELVIANFPKVLNCWKGGMPRSDIYMYGSVHAVDKVLHAINLRAKKSVADIAGTREDALKIFFGFGVEEARNGKSIFVVELERVPNDVIKILFPEKFTGDTEGDTEREHEDDDLKSKTVINNEPPVIEQHFPLETKSEVKAREEEELEAAKPQREIEPEVDFEHHEIEEDEEFWNSLQDNSNLTDSSNVGDHGGDSSGGTSVISGTELHKKIDNILGD